MNIIIIFLTLSINDPEGGKNYAKQERKLYWSSSGRLSAEKLSRNKTELNR